MNSTLPLFTKPVDSQHRIVTFFLRNEGKPVREIQKNAGRSTADTVSSLSSLSESAKNTIHWFGICQNKLSKLTRKQQCLTADRLSPRRHLVQKYQNSKSQNPTKSHSLRPFLVGPVLNKTAYTQYWERRSSICVCTCWSRVLKRWSWTCSW